MVGAAGFGGEADLAGAVGGDALAAVLGEGFMDFAQGVDVEFGNDESAVAGKSAAENAGRLDDLVDAGLDQLRNLAPEPVRRTLQLTCSATGPGLRVMRRRGRSASWANSWKS